MKLLILFLCVVASTAAVTAAVLFGGGGATARAAAPQRVSMEVLGDNDQMLGANLVLRPGRVVLTIVNYARHAHVFSIPALGVEQVVLPGSPSAPRTTTFSFTVRRDGAYEWYCRLPCGVRMMGEVYSGSRGPRPHGHLWAVSTT